MQIKILYSTILFFLIAASAQAAKPPVMDELLDQPENLQFSSSGFMECFVDTRALDVFRKDVCFSVDRPRTTTALFRIQGGPTSNFRVNWSDSRCSKSSKSCHLPIFSI